MDNCEGLTASIKDLALKEMRAGLVGIAATERLAGAPVGHRPVDFLPDAQVVVVLCLPIAKGLMRWNSFMQGSERIPETMAYVDDKGNARTWKPLQTIRKHIERRCSYETINDNLQRVSLYLALYLEEMGYEALYLPTTYGATHSWDDAGPKPPGGTGPMSHRNAAVAAGLGELGLNNLLLTPQYGPRVRLVSIITNAPLTPDEPLQEPLCLGEKCSLCVRNCPAQAFSTPHHLTMPGQTSLLATFDVEACRNYYNKSGGHCGRECMTSCPLVQGIGVRAAASNASRKLRTGDEVVPVSTDG